MTDERRVKMTYHCATQGRRSHDGRRALIACLLAIAALNCRLNPGALQADSAPRDAGVDSAYTDAPQPLDEHAHTMEDAAGDSRASLEDVVRSPFSMGRWGAVPAGGAPLPPFRLPVDLYSTEARLALDPAGRVWLVNGTVARTRSYEGVEVRSLVTLLDESGAVVARQDAAGAVSVDWIEVDAEGATVAATASREVRIGDLEWRAAESGERALLRFDAHGARLWWVRLVGAEPIRRSRYSNGRVAVVMQVPTEAVIGDRTIAGPRFVRVEFGERGAVTDLRDLGSSTGRGLRAMPLVDGGAMVYAHGDDAGSINAYDARGELRWRLEGARQDVLFDEHGRAMAITGGDLIRIDRDGSVQWSVPQPGLTAQFNNGVLSHLGFKLRPAVGAVLVLSPTRYDWEVPYNWSPCHPTPPSIWRTAIDGYTEDGDRFVSFGMLGSGEGAYFVDIAMSPGRTCALVVTPAESTRRDAWTQTLPSAIVCDGLGAVGTCGPTGFCAPCRADLLGDPNHCGACGRRCVDSNLALASCIQGVCELDRCDEHHADCDGLAETRCETELLRDANHCGACGNACPAGLACVAGRCAGTNAVWWSDGRDGDFAPTRDTVLPAGIHRFRDVVIPAGVTVRTTAEGTLDLRATGEVRVAGTIDLSGGDGEDAAPLASGGSTAGAPRGPAGTRGAGPAGGGGVGDPAVNAGAGPGFGVGGPSQGGLEWCQLPSSVPCFNRRLIGELPRYEGDYSVRCRACSPLIGSSRQCRVEATGSGVGGSIGLQAVRDLAAASTFAPGSGGGASGNRGNGAGGAGGGALRISAATRIVLSGTAALLARGGRGGVPEGGPGSGGVIVVAAPEVRIAAGTMISAVGGGTNGLGRIRITADITRCTLAGSFDPPLRDGCAPSNVMGFTYISNWR